MIKYGINNIRELVGHKVNLQMVYDSPICRLESWASPFTTFIFDGPDFPLPPHFYISLEKALHPLLIPASPSSASLNQLVWKQPAQKEGLFSQQHLKQITANMFLKGLRHTGAASVWTLCCHAKHQWESQLNYIPPFFLHDPTPVTTGNYLLVQEKILLQCNKCTIKGFSKYH